METWEELKKERAKIISKEFAEAGREGGMAIASPQVPGNSLPTNQFPGVDVGKVRVNTSSEVQPPVMPSMGQIPVGGGYIALSNAPDKGPAPAAPAAVPWRMQDIGGGASLLTNRQPINPLSTTSSVPKLDVAPVSLASRGPLDVAPARFGSSSLKLDVGEKAVSDFMQSSRIQSAGKRPEEENRFGIK